MTGWAALALGGGYVAVLVRRLHRQRLTAWQQLQRDRGRLRP